MNSMSVVLCVAGLRGLLLGDCLEKRSRWLCRQEKRIRRRMSAGDRCRDESGCSTSDCGRVLKCGQVMVWI